MPREPERQPAIATMLAKPHSKCQVRLAGITAIHKVLTALDLPEPAAPSFPLFEGDAGANAQSSAQRLTGVTSSLAASLVASQAG